MCHKYVSLDVIIANSQSVTITTYIVSFQRGNRFDALVLDMIEERLNKVFQTVRNWLEQSIHVLQVFALFLRNHFFTLRIQEIQVIGNHAVLALLAQFGHRTK